MHFIIFTLLLSVSSVLASQVPFQLSNLEALASCETEEDFFNYGLKQTLAVNGIRVVEDDYLDALLQNGSLFTISTFFQFRLDIFITNMRKIRTKINNDTFYTALLFSLLRNNPMLKPEQVPALAIEFCKCYKDHPESVSLVEFRHGFLRYELSLIGFLSFYMKNFEFVDKLIKVGLFDLNSYRCGGTHKGFKKSPMTYFPSLEGFRFALDRGFDFNQPIIEETQAGNKEVTALAYILKVFPEGRQIIDLLLEEFAFSDSVLNRAAEEFAQVGMVLTVIPVTRSDGKSGIKLKLMKISELGLVA